VGGEKGQKSGWRMRSKNVKEAVKKKTSEYTGADIDGFMGKSQKWRLPKKLLLTRGAWFKLA